MPHRASSRRLGQAHYGLADVGDGEAAVGWVFEDVAAVDGVSVTPPHLAFVDKVPLLQLPHDLVDRPLRQARGQSDLAQGRPRVRDEVENDQTVIAEEVPLPGHSP